MRESLIQNINSDADVEKIGASLSQERDDEQAVSSGSRKTSPESAKFEADSRANQKEDSLADGEVEGQEGDVEALDEELIRSLKKDLLCADTRVELPPLNPIIHPILNEGDSMILFAKTGVGKSWLSLEMAKAISEGGTFLGRYSVDTPRRVLYVDGEMGIRTLQTRLDKLKIHSRLFRYITCDYPLSHKTLDFAEKESRDALRYHIKTWKPDVVFLDNLTTLYTVDRTNQQESWAIMQNFILRLRNTGLAVVIVDHAGKGEGSGPRGTSAKTDIMQTVIELQKPVSYTDEQGARFNVFFSKHRNFFKDDAKPFEAWLKDDGWEINDVEPENTDTGPNGGKQKEIAFAMFDEGKTVQDVREVLGISQSTVYRWYEKWKKTKD